MLTDFAAWRTEPNWKKWWNGGREYVRFNEPGASGGYYTQKDICEILEYARQHYMTVIPEIEMPSHSEESAGCLSATVLFGRAVQEFGLLCR